MFLLSYVNIKNSPNTVCENTARTHLQAAPIFLCRGPICTYCTTEIKFTARKHLKTARAEISRYYYLILFFVYMYLFILTEIDYPKAVLAVVWWSILAGDAC